MDAVTDGFRQVVLVASGMDTRAFRLALPGDATVFELDQEAVLAEKRTVLRAVNAQARCRRVALAVDLERPRWPDVLIDAGFDVSRVAVVVVEGLSSYLTEEENALLLDELAGLAAAGSRLGIDMVSRDYLQNPAVARFQKWLSTKGIAWRFGTNEPDRFLAAHGWAAQVRTFDDVGRRFGRWPPPGVPDDVAARAASASRSFLIRAERV